MRPIHTALAVLVAAVWGFNFVVIEFGLGSFPPLLLSALRFLVAALPAVFFVGRPKVAWKWVIAVGVVLGIAKFGLLFSGMANGMPAGLSSLVLQAQAVFTAVFAAVVLKERPGRLRIAGMAVAFTGIAVAAVDEGASGPVLGFTMVIAAAACWGVSNVLTRKASPPDALNFMVWVSVVPVLPLTALSLLIEGPERDLAALRGLDWSGVGVIVYLAWITTVFGFGAWGYLLRTYPASSVAPFSLLVPVFGMSSAALVLGEDVSGLRWVAAVLLVGGVAATSLVPSKPRPATAAGDTPAAGSVAASVPASASAPASVPAPEPGSDAHRDPEPDPGTAVPLPAAGGR